MDSSAINQLLANDTMVFSLIIIIIIAIVLIIIVFQWRKVAQSKNSILMLEKEIELKKMSMVEKDIESKRLMDNPIPLPQEQQDSLSAIRQSTTEVRSNVGYLHSEINERLARLEAETEQRKLEKMLKEIEAKGDVSGRLAVSQEFKAAPFSLVWDYYCQQKDAGVGLEWLEEVRAYEKDVLSKR